MSHNYMCCNQAERMLSVTTRHVHFISRHISETVHGRHVYHR